MPSRRRKSAVSGRTKILFASTVMPPEVGVQQSSGAGSMESPAQSEVVPVRSVLRAMTQFLAVQS